MARPECVEGSEWYRDGHLYPWYCPLCQHGLRREVWFTITTQGPTGQYQEGGGGSRPYGGGGLVHMGGGGLVHMGEEGGLVDMEGGGGGVVIIYIHYTHLSCSVLREVMRRIIWTPSEVCGCLRSFVVKIWDNFANMCTRFNWTVFVIKLKINILLLYIILYIFHLHAC